ncbi:NAD(P)-binding domain-containing protein [Limibacter armeniacum]|uniref:NAD(P)-binding domain-containing protein n=1 Tax=Limibacter armeniacum TaxID=466084 RepID=UPI002FE655EF
MRMKNVGNTPPKVAIIGGGPSGLTTAKSLLEEGFTPIIMELSSHIGGQWNAKAPHSGVWNSLRTNTSWLTLCFSDFPHKEGIPMFPKHNQILEYLTLYATHFKLTPYIRLNCKVQQVSTLENGKYQVASLQDGQVEEEVFDYVVVASGRYNKPKFPNLNGLDSFTGEIIHSFDYKDNQPFQNKRVLVIGNSISGPEIASEMATDPSITVFSSCRKPRYYITKTLAGIPADCAAFSRFASLIGKVLPPEAAAQGLKDLIIKHCGHPNQYGAPTPSENILEADVSLCQYYLNYVSEGKILPRPNVSHIKGNTVVFDDGSEETIDVLILATGYDIHLPFLDDKTLKTLNANPDFIDLYQYTFHPSLPNMAFTGQFGQIGPYFPVLELQGRWISMIWKGLLSLPSKEEMEQFIITNRELLKIRVNTAFHDMALLFAQEIGAAPNLEQYPHLAKAFLFGPLIPQQFRIEGHGKIDGALKEYEQAIKAFGNNFTSPLSPEEIGGLRMVAESLNDPSLIQLVSLLDEKVSNPIV